VPHQRPLQSGLGLLLRMYRIRYNDCHGWSPANRSLPRLVDQATRQDHRRDHHAPSWSATMPWSCCCAAATRRRRAATSRPPKSLRRTC